MSALAISTLLGPQAGVRNSPLFVQTISGEHYDLGDEPSHPPSWELATGSRVSFEQALLEALARGHGYPATPGETMLRSLGWQNGLSLVCRLDPAALRLALTDLTCRLLPEMVPVPATGGGVTWLDTALPIFRTLAHVNRPMVARCPDASLAILYQVERDGIFEALAEKIRRDLPLELAVDGYPGEDLADEARRVAMMQQIFFQHRAVLFLGHLRRPTAGSSGGWMMTENQALPLSEVQTFLGGSRSRRQVPWRPSASTPPVPELVICGCCCGAWGDPGSRGVTDLFYPELFLDAGVRFFVGSWTDVVVRLVGGKPTRSPDLDTLARLFSGFLGRWSNAPDHAVAHLYQTKKAMGFPLLASLFQLYTAVEPLPVEETKDQASPALAIEAPPAPCGALVDRLGRGMILGPYRLESELWRDRYAVGFWAESQSSRHIVQVLADAWQGEAVLQRDIERELEHLRSLGLGEGHLVPDRLESLPLPDVGDGALRLLALVYDRPKDEAREDWFPLRENPLDRNHNDHYRRVLELGAQAGRRLWELHAKGVLHGNFDPGCIAIHRRVSPGQIRETIYVKDAWVQRVRPGRCTDDRYAAPEEPAQESGPAQLKQDCWGLGVVLYELATGHPPNQYTSIREAVGSHADRVPEALDRVVRECLMPAAAVRPSAEVVARRLLLAINLGGTYVEDIEAQFDVAVRAGHRLFAVRVDDIAEIERVLHGLQEHPRADIRYHLYVAEEEKGIVDSLSNRTILAWMDAASVQQERSQATGQQVERPSPPVVAARNGLAILSWAATLASPPEGEMPVLLLRGCDWWEGQDLYQMVFAWRVLKHSQREWGYPVIVVTDSLIRPIGDLASLFLLLDFPPPPPSELFERLLAASKTVPGGAPLAPETAASIGDRLFPCPTRELEEVFRLCALRHRCIDERIVEIRDQERGRRFDGAGIMSYLPFAALPQLNHVGWPPALAEGIPAWLAGLREEGIGPRCVLIVGPHGYGKSFAAQALVGALRRPLIRLEVSRCLRSELGGSEAWLRAALRDINNLGGVAVLLDSIEGFTPSSGEEDTTVSATLTRMSSILRDWIGSIPPSVVVLMTAKDEGAIPGSWRRLFDLRLVMDAPAVHGVDPVARRYREAVFRALLYKFQLSTLAENDGLISHLARETHPSLRGRPLPSAIARLRPGSALGRLEVELRDGSQIEDWIATTILHHTPLGDPDRPRQRSFWEEAVK